MPPLRDLCNDMPTRRDICQESSQRAPDFPPTHGYPVNEEGKGGFRLFNLPTLVPGRVSGLCGPNGIGKSTVLNILAGTLKPNFNNTTLTQDQIRWEQIVPRLKENEMRDHFIAVARGTRKIAYKQQVLRVLFDVYKDRRVLEILEAECEVNQDFFHKILDILDIDAIATATSRSALAASSSGLPLQPCS